MVGITMTHDNDIESSSSSYISSYLLTISY